MYRFFIDPSNLCGDFIYIEGSDYNHLKNVLRVKANSDIEDEGSLEEISVVIRDDDKEYRCHVENYEDERAVLKIRFVKENDVELPCKVYLFQCLPKADKMELIIQKAVELGVYEVIPVSSKRAIVKLDDKKKASKISRWQGVSEAAAKQAKRAIIPKIQMPMSYKEAMEYAKSLDVKILPYELCNNDSMNETRDIFTSIKSGDSVAVIIGPEGGFEDSEIDIARETGFKTVTLGKRILRTETAGMTVLSWLVYLLE